MSATSIGWTDYTINPCRGCDPVSPGCAFCYAAVIAARFSGPGMAFEGLGKWKGEGGRRLAVWTKEPVRLVPEAFLEALSWRKPRRVFVCSVSDLFHDDVPFTYIAAWWALMAITPHVTYQIVTKRPERMLAFFMWVREQNPEHPADHWFACLRELVDRMKVAPEQAKHRAGWERASATIQHKFKAVTATAEIVRKTTLETLPNVWLMTSTENQEWLDKRVPFLLQCPAVVHGISAEPLLGPLNLRAYLKPEWITVERPRGPMAFLRPNLRWVIPGGESDDHARPCEGDWIRGVVGHVLAAQRGGVEVALFLKQLGSRYVDARDGIAGKLLDISAANDLGVRVRRLQAEKGDDPSEWPDYLQGLQGFPGDPFPFLPTTPPAQLDLAV